MISYQNIYDKIATSNNGKLLLCRFTQEEKFVLGEMRDQNLVAPASFMTLGDSVKVHSKNPLCRG